MATVMKIEEAQRKRDYDWCDMPIKKGVSCLSISRYNMSANLCTLCVEIACHRLTYIARELSIKTQNAINKRRK